MTGLILLLFLLVFTWTSLASECHYKGSVYHEGETILIEEPCVSCTCQQGALVCSLRVCQQLPDPPPQGCVIVHKNHNCCPQLICEDPGVHYVDQSTQARILNSTHGCTLNGSVFSEGSALTSSSLCEYCYCIGGRQKCIRPHCVMPMAGCRPSYQEHACCPTHYDCSEVDKPSTAKPIVGGCEQDGALYAEGSQMPSSGACENCYCMNGKPTCGPVRCTVQHLEDCYPVYTNGQCCPSTYNCTKRFTNLNNPLTSNKLRSIETGPMSYQNRSKTPTTSSTEQLTKYTTTMDPPTSAIADVLKGTTDAVAEGQEITENPLATAIGTDGYTTEYMNAEVTTESMNGTTEFEDASTVTDFTTEEEFSDTTAGQDWGTSYASESLGELLSTTASTMSDTTTASNPPTTLPAELNIITAPDNFYSISLSSNVRFNGANRSDMQIGVQERKQPEDSVINNTRKEEDYASYDYEEPQLPPSLPNLVIYPFVAAEAVTKEEGEKSEGASSKIDEEAPVYYKSYFSPPKETEGGFVPKEDSVLEIPGYEDKYFNTDTPDVHQIFNNPQTIPSITAPPSPVAVTETSTERMVDMTIIHPQFPTLPPVTVADIIDVTPDPFRDVIRTEPAPDLPALMSDILPYLKDQQTKKPVSVNYKNVVIDYYPNHFITTRRDDERKTTMVIEKSPVYRPTTEAINISSIEFTSTSPIYRPKLPEEFYITTEYSEMKANKDVTEEPLEETAVVEPEPVTTTQIPSIRTSIRQVVLETTEPVRRIELETEANAMVPTTTTKRPNILGLRPKPVKTTLKPTTESDSFLDEFLKGFFESNTEVPSSTVPESPPYPNVGQKYSSKIRDPPFTTSTMPSVDLIENRGGEEENAGSFSLDSVLHMLFDAEENNSKDNSTTIRPLKVKNSTKFTRKPINRKTKKPQAATVPVMKLTKPPVMNTTVPTIMERDATVVSANITTVFSSSTSTTPTTTITTADNQEIKSTTRADSPFVTDVNTGFPKINILRQEKIKPNKIPQNFVEDVTENKVPEERAKIPAKLSGGLGSILKLAGCNIYGRMYRVGKIIAELSSPCLECMCTDSGVQCSQLVC